MSHWDEKDLMGDRLATGLGAVTEKIKGLQLDLGLMTISRDQRAVLLESCEIALAERDDEITALKSQLEAAKWISLRDELPEYGVPVLIVGNSVTQYVTYMLDGDGETCAWFEPYYFDHDDDLKIWASEITYWMPLPIPPNK